MSNFGPGVYLLIVVWCITLMLCWVSLRTGHYVGKLAFAVSLTLTLVLVCLPRGESKASVDFYDKLFVLRYAILVLLLISAVVGCGLVFFYDCLTNIEARKLRSFSAIN